MERLLGRREENKATRTQGKHLQMTHQLHASVAGA